MVLGDFQRRIYASETGAFQGLAARDVLRLPLKLPNAAINLLQFNQRLYDIHRMFSFQILSCQKNLSVYFTE